MITKTKLSGLSRRHMLALTGAGALATSLQACGNSPQETHDKPIKPLVSANSWSTAPSLPAAVQEIYPCLHKNRIHLAGGFVAQNGRISGPTAAHHSWSPHQNSWQTEAPLPIARHHPHMISFKDHLLAIAGFESSSTQSIWEIQKSGWRLSNNDWDVIPALPMPAAEAVTAVLGDGHLHLAGGRTWAVEGKTGGWQDHTDTDHHFVLQELGGTWEKAAPCPHKRNSAAGGVIDGNLHIVGGRQVGGGNLAHHSVYDYKEDRWRDAAPMPQAQGGLAAAVVKGKLYAFGGEFFDNGGGVYPESWAYDPTSDSWTTLPDMPAPRHGLGAVELGGKIYVIGGALQASGVDTSARGSPIKELSWRFMA